MNVAGMNSIFGGDAVGEIRVGDVTLKFAVSSVELSTEMKEIKTRDGDVQFLARGQQKITLSGILLEAVPEAAVETVRRSLLEASRRKFRNL